MLADHPFSSAYPEWFRPVGHVGPIAIPTAHFPTSLRWLIVGFLLDAYRVAVPFATTSI